MTLDCDSPIFIEELLIVAVAECIVHSTYARITCGCPKEI